MQRPRARRSCSAQRKSSTNVADAHRAFTRAGFLLRPAGQFAESIGQNSDEHCQRWHRHDHNGFGLTRLDHFSFLPLFTIGWAGMPFYHRLGWHAGSAIFWRQGIRMPFRGNSKVCWHHVSLASIVLAWDFGPFRQNAGCNLAVPRRHLPAPPVSRPATLTGKQVRATLPMISIGAHITGTTNPAFILPTP